MALPRVGLGQVRVPVLFQQAAQAALVVLVVAVVDGDKRGPGLQVGEHRLNRVHYALPVGILAVAVVVAATMLALALPLRAGLRASRSLIPSSSSVAASSMLSSLPSMSRSRLSRFRLRPRSWVEHDHWSILLLRVAARRWWRAVRFGAGGR